MFTIAKLLRTAFLKNGGCFRLVFSRFLNLSGNLGIAKEKPTRKTCFSRERKRLAPRIYQAKFCLARFFEVNGISIIFSREIDVKTRESI